MTKNKASDNKMSDKNPSAKNNTLGKILIGGGILLLIIIAAGVYLSMNPQLISKWQYQRDSARMKEMQLILLEAPASCQGKTVGLFASACEHLDDSTAWYSQLSSEAQTCMQESARITTEFKLKFDGESLSHIEKLLRDEDIVLHACGVNEDVNFYVKGSTAADAAELLNHWYQWKFEEGNYFN